MDGADAISAVVDGIYAASMAPDEWPRALEGMIDLLHAGHMVLVADSGEDKNASWSASARIDERDLAYCVSQLDSVNAGPLAPHALPVGVVQTRADLISDHDFMRSAYYNEVVRPMNGFHSVQFRQRRPATSFLAVICRPPQADNFGTTDRSALQAVAPHLSNAIEMRDRLRLAEHREQSLSCLLDRLNTGVILTDAAARPSFVNARAAEIVAELDGLTVEVTGLAAATLNATRRLRRAIAAVAAPTAIESRRLSLERPSHRPPLFLTLLPIWRLGTGVPGARAPRVAIFIQQPDAPVSVDTLAVAEAFHLTGRESEIAALLFGGVDLLSIAATLGLSHATVRSHLRRIFEKTGTHSQVELAARMRSLMDLFR